MRDSIRWLKYYSQLVWKPKDLSYEHSWLWGWMRGLVKWWWSVQQSQPTLLGAVTHIKPAGAIKGNLYLNQVFPRDRKTILGKITKIVDSVLIRHQCVLVVLANAAFWCNCMRIRKKSGCATILHSSCAFCKIYYEYRTVTAGHHICKLARLYDIMAIN